MEKRIFHTEPVPEPSLQPKREFSEAEVVSEETPREVAAELVLDDSFKPPRFWTRLFLGAMGLFGVAVLAQSVQWLWDTWQAHQWIYFAFALAFWGVSLAGVGALVGEWRKLRQLRRHQQTQQESEIWLANLTAASGENAAQFCQNIGKKMPASMGRDVALQRWQNELSDAHSAQEVLFLFSENVLKPLDEQAKTLISRSAVENAILVGVSPLALVDVLFVAWRNIALVNKLSRLYGMELGYFSRLKLFKMVLTNMAFAGATEMASDVAMDYLSQNVLARLSLRAAQGIGVGLLTARLGIKAMEFCRPVVFQPNERPKLSLIRQEFFNTLKARGFAFSSEKETVKSAS